MTARPMRILVLTKRQYTGKDLIDDRYGRLFEIPKHLSHLGHQVQGLSLSYRQRENVGLAPEITGGVLWETINSLPFSPTGAVKHLQRIRALCISFRPDVVWASSDSWHAIAARRVCLPLGIPYVIDLYDNYESFGLSRPPGIIPLFRRACRAASGLTLVSRTLAEYVQTNYLSQYNVPLLQLGNAVDTSLFKPLDKQQSRGELGLPANEVLIGTAGALDHTRGIETLFEAYERLARTKPGIRLVIAGPRDSTMNRFRHLPMIDLGVLPATKIPFFWNSMDVAIVQNRDSNFGRYCYPQKLQEIISCNVPLVATCVGEINELLTDYPQCLAEPDSSTSLAERIAYQIEHRTVVDRSEVRTWEERARNLSEFLEVVVSGTIRRIQSNHQQ
jgi:glycosyltransferase involved in cell wall biosynthesis